MARAMRDGWQHGDPFRNTDLKCPNLTGRSADTSTSLGIFHSVVQIGGEAGAALGTIRYIHIIFCPMGNPLPNRDWELSLLSQTVALLGYTH